MNIITAILIATVVAGLTPIAQQLTNTVVQGIRRKRAFARLKRERLISVGTVFMCIRDGSGGPPLAGLCEVVDLSLGRVAIQCFAANGVGTGLKMSWTGQEFEKMHPVVMVDPSTGTPLSRKGVADLHEAHAAKEKVVQFPAGGTPRVH